MWTTSPAGPVDLGDEVWLVDTRMGGYDGITAGYLIRGERPCLVETGAARSAVRGRATRWRTLGVGADDLATIVVTHIHLDHAGGVGDLAAAFPRAAGGRARGGCPAPRRPVAADGAARAMVFGDVLDELFGPLLPTDAERIRVLADGDTIDLGGGRQPRVVRLARPRTPPRRAARLAHRRPLHRRRRRRLDAGDRRPAPGDAAARTSTSTPRSRSLDRMRERAPTRLLFSHFGPVTDVGTTLDRSVEELRLWVELVREARSDGLDLDHAVVRVRERTAERYALRSVPEVEHKIEVLSSTEADVAGIWRWLDRQSELESGAS